MKVVDHYEAEVTLLNGKGYIEMAIKQEPNFFSPFVLFYKTNEEVRAYRDSEIESIKYKPIFKDN